MNPYFDICKENYHPNNKFQSNNLGQEMVMASIMSHQGIF